MEPFFFSFDVASRSMCFMRPLLYNGVATKCLFPGGNKNNHGFAKKIVCLLAAAVSLASCDFMSIFGGGSSSEEVKDHPYSGHYLFDIYEPTQNKNPGVYYAHGDNTLTMDNEPRYECFLFKTGDEDTSVTFNLEKGKYKSLCFIAGLAENHFTHIFL